MVVGRVLQRHLLVSGSGHRTFLSSSGQFYCWVYSNRLEIYAKTKCKRTADSRGFVVLCKAKLKTAKVAVTQQRTELH